VRRVPVALGVWSAAAYLAVLPFRHVTALRSIALLLALAAAIALWRRPGRLALPLLAAYGVWLLAAGISLFATRDLEASLRAIDNDILRSCVVFLVFYTLARHAASWAVWTAATAAGFGVLSLLAIAAFVGHGEWTPNYVPLLGDYTTCAVTVLPLLAGYLILPGRNRRIAWLVYSAVPVVLVAGYLTFSRAFWLVLMCGGLLGAILYARQRGGLGRRLLMPLALLCVAAVGLAAAAAMERDRSPGDISDREAIYSAAVRKIMQNPPTGSGYGYETDKAWYAAALPQWSVFHAHNIVLSYIEQMGVVGLAALLAIFGAPAMAFVRSLHAPSIEARTAAICGLTLLLCVFVKNNLDYFFIQQNLWLFFAHLGMYLGEIERRGGTIGP
jgi:O-antigen ligase